MFSSARPTERSHHGTTLAHHRNGNDGRSSGLCGVLGVEGWARDPRFATNLGRDSDRVEMDRELRAEAS